MQRMEQHCTAIHIPQRGDPRQGHVAINEEEEWGEGCSGLSTSITQGEQWCVKTGTATSVDSQLANRARRRVFAEGHAFSLSLLPQCLHLIFFNNCLHWEGSSLPWVDALSNTCIFVSYWSSLSVSIQLPRQVVDDRRLEGFERKIHFI